MRVILDHASDRCAVGLHLFLTHQQEACSYLGHYLRGCQYFLHFSLFLYLLGLHLIPADVQDSHH